MEGTCSICRQSVRLYRKRDGWSNRETGSLLADSHRRGRQYLCPGSHRPALPRRHLSARMLIVIGLITLLAIAAILIVLR